MFRALAEHPSTTGSAPEDGRHFQALRLLVDVIGNDLRTYLIRHGAPYLAHWRHRHDPVAAMASWLAEYYLQMHDLMRIGPDAVANWPELVCRARAVGRTVRLVVTMQLGYPLLLPILLEQATGRAAYPVVHDQNPAVLSLYAEHLRFGRALILTELTAADIRGWLGSDGILLANIDTSYPGTQHVRELPFLTGRLTVPAGLLSLAVRRGAEVRAMTVPGSVGRLALRSSQPLPSGDTVAALREFGRCFEQWVSATPEQWMAWSSLRNSH
ncbi:hypothetical protein [Virgisporangium ochraceum]|nr:hypothetical protein [Virgisporangium ochraceum]